MRTIWLIIRKETLQVLRDKRMLFQIFIPPVVQLLILAQAMTFEVRHTDLALVDLDRSPASERLVDAFVASGRFDVVRATASGAVADDALLTREAGFILRIPDGFARDLQRGTTPTVQLVMNAEDGAAAGVTLGYANRIIAGFSQAEAARGPMLAATAARAGPGVAPPGIEIRTRKLYNPEGRYLAYMAIGLLASLVTLVGILLASQNIAREKEIGTLEQLNVTPITKTQFILGKLTPFWVLGLIELTVGLLVIRFGFGISFAGAVGVVYLAAALYLIAALGLGLLVSTVAATQQQAQFVTFFVLVTFFFLGGIFTPVQSMPEWAQVVAEVNPIKHFAVVLRGVLMKGAGLEAAAYPMAMMAAFGAVALTLAGVRYRKTAG